MSCGAPWERGVGAADRMSQRDMEVPGLVPDVGGVELVTKKARRHRSQHGRRQRRRGENVSRTERSLADRDRCFNVIAEAVDDHRRELRVISRLSAGLMGDGRCEIAVGAIGLPQLRPAVG